MYVPLSSFTLFFSELTTEPWFAGAALVSFRSGIPTTPSVCAVIGGRAFVLVSVSRGMLLPTLGAEGVGDCADPPIPPAREGLGLAPVPAFGTPSVLPPALFWLFCGPMIAWMDIGICTSLPSFM